MSSSVHFEFCAVGGMLIRGPGLTILESTAVLPKGRGGHEDLGFWDDSQIPAFKQLVDFAHSQGQKIGIQFNHAGRKSSTRSVWLTNGTHALTKEEGGWPDEVYAPSAEAFSPNNDTPKEMTVEDIKEVVDGFKQAARRAVEAGFDVIEIHGAHGFLLSEFSSPTSNKRTDAYGGSFENRTRIHVKIIDAIRSVIPEKMPLLFRYVTCYPTEEVLILT